MDVGLWNDVRFGFWVWVGKILGSRLWSPGLVLVMVWFV